jgi:tRNA-dihydrouridine synthase
MLFEKHKSTRLFLAPMAGITDWTFRTLMKKYGAEVVTSELISADGLFFGGKRTQDLMKMNLEFERPVGIQIFGSDTGRMVLAAKAVEKAGADFVDINLGCPVRKVVKKGAGSALMKDPKSLSKILISIKSEISIPLTIKIRTEIQV